MSDLATSQEVGQVAISHSCALQVTVSQSLMSKKRDGQLGLDLGHLARALDLVCQAPWLIRSYLESGQPLTDLWSVEFGSGPRAFGGINSNRAVHRSALLAAIDRVW